MTLVDRVTEPFRMIRFATDSMPSRRDLWTQLRDKEILLADMHHRIGNSLQMIASTLAMEARDATCVDARQSLVRAHRRILAVAAVQQQLQVSSGGAAIDFEIYLRQLAESLAASAVGAPDRISIEVRADAGDVSSETATTLGLIVTELVINAVKHAFASDASGVISIIYGAQGAADTGWTLAVADNGAGLAANPERLNGPGMGTRIITSLAGKLGARIETCSGPDETGTRITIFGAPAPRPERVGA